MCLVLYGGAELRVMMPTQLYRLGKDSPDRGESKEKSGKSTDSLTLISPTPHARTASIPRLSLYFLKKIKKSVSFS
jgi:hypothetical protein